MYVGLYLALLVFKQLCYCHGMGGVHQSVHSGFSDIAAWTNATFYGKLHVPNHQSPNIFFQNYHIFMIFFFVTYDPTGAKQMLLGKQIASKCLLKLLNFYVTDPQEQEVTKIFKTFAILNFNIFSTIN